MKPYLTLLYGLLCACCALGADTTTIPNGTNAYIIGTFETNVWMNAYLTNVYAVEPVWNMSMSDSNEQWFYMANITEPKQRTNTSRWTAFDNFDPSHTNVFIEVTHQPKITRSNDVWIITFKP